jgi:hypothetical protein
MKRLSTLFLLAVMLTAGLSSCSKYEDGPSLSLRSKKARLCHEWKIVKVTEVVTVDEIDVTAHWADLTYDYKKDGAFYRTRNNVTSTGTWKFDDDKENLILTLDGSTTPEIYEIKRLAYKELWVNSEIANKTTKFKFAIKEE